MIHDPTAIFNQLIGWVAQHRIVLLFVTCVFLGASGAWLISGIPFRVHLLDNPNHRSSHKVPTPRGGGVGILLAFIVGGLSLNIPTTFLFSAILISGISFYGDYLRISVKLRLLVQVICAFIFIFPMLPRISAYFTFFTLGSYLPFFFLILPMIFLFIIGTANFYNFMDGINGIAGFSGVIAFGILGIYNLYQPYTSDFQANLSLLAICIAAACLGYLPFNMPRARVFMGDVGSILLGFVFAGLVIYLARSYLEMACFTALLFPFYADELTTMAIRLKDHENLIQSHRHHLYQILVNEAGIAHWKVTIAYCTVQLVVGIGVLIVYSYDLRYVLPLLAVCFISFAILSFQVRNKYRFGRDR